MTTELEKKVYAHKDFPKLIREVAIAEQPMGRPRRLSHADWYLRGVRRPRRKVDNDRRYNSYNRRAWLLAEQIAKDVPVLPSLPQSEANAWVYIRAREFMRSRQITVR